MSNIKQIKEKALQDHIPIIMDDTLEEVAKILKEVKPKKILEIGTAIGYSAIRFSEYLDKDGIIDTIERDEERVREAIENIQEMHLEDKIHIFRGDALEILPTLTGPYDIVFIDAAKGKYPIFLKEALRMLNKNGIIIADNVLYKGYVMSDYNKHKQRTAVRGLRQFLSDLDEDENLNTQILEVGDGLVISRRKEWD